MSSVFKGPKVPKTSLPPVPDPAPTPSADSEVVQQRTDIDKKRRKQAVGGQQTILTERYNTLLGS